MGLHVDVVSDVICPWCFIGKRRLEKALRTLAGRVETQVVWHPFELNPEMPREGIERRAYREAKFGSLQASRAIDARLAAAGATEGISFAFDRIRRTPSTLDAHRLIWLAQRESLQEPIVEALFRKYFLEGEDIGARKALVDVAAASGLSRERVDGFLESEDGVASVRQAEAEARSLGIHGVPLSTGNTRSRARRTRRSSARCSTVSWALSPRRTRPQRSRNRPLLPADGRS